MATTRSIRLGADEVVLIETEEQSSVVGLINEGVFAACSNVISVCCLVTSSKQTGSEVRSRCSGPKFAAVCMPTNRQRPRASDRLWARYRRIASTVAWSTTTLVRGSNSYFAWYFLPTKSLLALDGFFDHGSTEAAEMEFGLALPVSCPYRDDRSRSHC